jgi:uncharacterized phage-like protein YoqJ
VHNASRRRNKYWNWSNKKNYPIVFTITELLNNLIPLSPNTKTGDIKLTEHNDYVITKSELLNLDYGSRYANCRRILKLGIMNQGLHEELVKLIYFK